jgi:hypothetical protein
MTFRKRISQVLGVVALGALVATSAFGQVTTRFVAAGGSATTVKVVPGGTVSMDVRIDVGTLPAGDTGIIGTAFRIEQTAPATNGFFSITGRSFTGSPFNDASSGTADSIVLVAPSNLLDPDNNDNVGRSTVGLVPVPPAANILAVNLTLTVNAATPLGTYHINAVPGVSFATTDGNFDDFDMSTGAGIDIVVGQTLTVVKTGTGTGTVTSDVGAINCGAVCSDIFAGDTVTLTATPTAGSTFTGWSGGGCSGTGTCVVTVTAATSVTANFDVVGATLPPTISKAFAPTSVTVGGASTLSFTITNPNNASSLTGVGFTDTLPAGVVVSTPNALTGTCGGGTITATAASGSVSLSGATLASSASCTFSVSVTANTAGTKNNVTGAVTSAEGGPGNTASATLTVAGISAPTITKAFAPTSIVVGGSSTLSFTITNSNAATAFTGVAFTDTLPAGVVVSTPNALTGTCGAGTITATAGSGSISLAGGTIAAASNCTFSVSVTASTSGTKNNTTGTVSSTEGGTGGTASATLTVAAITPPAITKAFGASAIPPLGTTTLTFTIRNNNASTTLTGVGFTDNLPAGLALSTPSGLTGSCGGGTITATDGSTSVSLTGASLAANTSCSFTVNVTASSLGTKVNTTSVVTSVEGGDGNTASATVTVGVLAPIPTLSQWALWILSLLMLAATGVVMYSRRKG